MQRGLAAVLEQFGRLDILVNCAGIAGPTGVNIVEYSAEAFDQVLAVNLRGAFLTTRAGIAAMLPQQYGRILQLVSIGGKDGNPGMVGYAASKAGMTGLIKSAGKEYATSGITVNGLAPAVIRTPIERGHRAGNDGLHGGTNPDGAPGHSGGGGVAGLLDRFARGQLQHRLHLRPLRRARATY